jgi:hypothetical protein
MKDAPSWQDIYGGPLPDNLPPVPRNATPIVDVPECPRDCTGRHGVDGPVFCEACKAPAYQVWWHEYRVNRGVNFHTVQRVNGAPVLHASNMPCPACGGQFRT